MQRKKFFQGTSGFTGWGERPKAREKLTDFFRGGVLKNGAGRKSQLHFYTERCTMPDTS